MKYQKIILLILLAISLSLGCVPTQLSIKNIPGFPESSSTKSFTIRNVYDIRGTPPDAIASREAVKKYGYRKLKNTVKTFITTTFDTTLQITELKASSPENADYFIDLVIEKYELEIKNSWSLKNSASATSLIYVTFFDAKTNTPVITAKINEQVSSKAFILNEKKLLDSLITKTNKQFIDMVIKIAESSSGAIKELASTEEFKPIPSNTFLLSSIQNLKTELRDSNLIVSWETFTGPDGIAKTLYKLGEAPTGNWDTTGSLNASPDTIPVTREGIYPLSVWIADNSGNVNFKDALSNEIKYYKPFYPKDLSKNALSLGVHTTLFPIPTAGGYDKSFKTPGTDKAYVSSLFLGYGINAGCQFRILPHLLLGLSGDARTLGTLAESWDYENSSYDTDAEKCIGSGIGFTDIGADFYARIFAPHYLCSIKPTIGWRRFSEFAGIKLKNNTSGEERTIEKDLSKEGLSYGGEFTIYTPVNLSTLSVSLGYSYYPFFDNLYKITVAVEGNARNKGWFNKIYVSSAGPCFELYQNKNITCIIFSLKANCYF